MSVIRALLFLIVFSVPFAAVAEDSVVGTCDELPEKIRNCEAYSCHHKSPLENEMEPVEVTILGLLDNERCHIKQTLPDNKLSDCKYSKKVYLVFSDIVAKYFAEGYMRVFGEQERILGYGFDNECVVGQRK